MRFERRLASSFGDGRLWLAGDAAHLTGPGGVQSMNLGLAEASDLTTRIAGVLREAKPLSSIAAYDESWSSEWRRMMGLSASLRGPSADPWAASHAGQLLSCLPAHGEEAVKLAEQVGLT